MIARLEVVLRKVNLTALESPRGRTLIIFLPKIGISLHQYQKKGNRAIINLPWNTGNHIRYSAFAMDLKSKCKMVVSKKYHRYIET